MRACDAGEQQKCDGKNENRSSKSKRLRLICLRPAKGPMCVSVWPLKEAHHGGDNKHNGQPESDFSVGKSNDEKQ